MIYIYIYIPIYTQDALIDASAAAALCTFMNTLNFKPAEEHLNIRFEVHE